MEVKLSEAATVLGISKIKELWCKEPKTVNLESSHGPDHGVNVSDSESEPEKVDVKRRKRRKLNPHLLENCSESNVHPFRQAWRSCNDALDDLSRKLSVENPGEMSSLDFTGIQVGP